jgi:hypothetical protein
LSAQRVDLAPMWAGRERCQRRFDALIESQNRHVK